MIGAYHKLILSSLSFRKELSMSVQYLHIISFNVPYPADYGGVVDVFYRLKALHAAGVKIHLHCFTYGRVVAPELNQYCEEVVYYQRSMSFIHQFSGLPFIVKTRSNSALLQNLMKDDYPILFEGLHSCYFLDHPKLKERVKIVRCHNVEHDYYHSLATKTPTWSLKQYFRWEASKLKRFETVLLNANHIGAISRSDYDYFQKEYGKTFLMPPCHPNDGVKIAEGKGEFILYHGNLSVQENDEAARFIVEKIALYVNFPFIVAGKNPSKSLRELASSCPNVQIISNPEEDKMNQLIADTHINLLPTFQATGFKLKLLNALFNGRFCIGTPQLTEGTGLDELCMTVENDRQMIAEINNVLGKEFSTEMVQFRKQKLNDSFSNQSAVSKLINLI
jgi:hypothetical protein